VAAHATATGEADLLYILVNKPVYYDLGFAVSKTTPHVNNVTKDIAYTTVPY